MKNLFLIIGGVIVSGLLIWGIAVWGGSNPQVAGYSAGDPNAPKLEITEKTFDFGKIALSDVVKHEFKIKNVGKNPLIVTDIMTSCHCASAVMKVPGKPDSPEFTMGMSDWKGEIAPDGEASIEVIYSPSKMPVKGKVSRVVTLVSNDPSSKDVQLEVLADVQ